MNDSPLERIGSAAAGIAHDINNQLNLIVNHLSLPGVDGEGVNYARQAAQRCSALTASLLSYCKRPGNDIQSLDLSRQLRSFASQLRLPSGVKVEFDVPNSLPLIRGSKMGIDRALRNLVGNACDAMECRGTLRITASPQQIDVSDSGPGICTEVIKRIFEPFYSTKGEEGYGMGLAIVRELMREQGGHVSVVSEPGHGATFTLRFRPA